MSTASVPTLPLTPASALSLSLMKGLRHVRATTKPVRSAAAQPLRANPQEAQKLRALARDMMRIDAGSAADLFAAADRHEFGYRA